MGVWELGRREQRSRLQARSLHLYPNLKALQMSEMGLTVHLSLSIFVYLSICPSICLSIISIIIYHLSIYPLSINLLPSSLPSFLFHLHIPFLKEPGHSGCRRRADSNLHDTCSSEVGGWATTHASSSPRSCSTRARTGQSSLPAWPQGRESPGGPGSWPGSRN